MPLHDEVCLVQFIHPRPEPKAIENGRMGWNSGDDHERRFVQTRGECRNSRGGRFEGPLRLWCEWEAQSFVKRINDQPVGGLPECLHRPFYVRSHSCRSLQNTDPFVFGGFFYMGCQQNTKRGATQLRYLDRGSVILFGSCIDGSFGLDTVFVVDSWEDHSEAHFRRHQPRLFRAYWDVTFRPWYANEHPRLCRVYRGATAARPVQGMFSFFPCMPAERSPTGFGRPIIELPNIITQGLRQHYRLTRGLTVASVAEYWRDVRDQVEQQHLWLGVKARIPKRRHFINDSRRVSSPSARTSRCAGAVSRC